MLKSEIRNRLKNELDKIVILLFESQIEEWVEKCQIKKIKKEMSFEIIIYIKI